jgi:hypothetical protein
MHVIVAAAAVAAVAADVIVDVCQKKGGNKLPKFFLRQNTFFSNFIDIKEA